MTLASPCMMPSRLRGPIATGLLTLLSHNTGRSNPLPKGSDSGKQAILETSGGSERERSIGMRLDIPRAVGAPSATGLGAGTKSLVHDGLDGARAPAAFSAAAEAAIELLGIAGQIFRRRDGTADIVVAKDVAGTNNHEERAGLSVMRRKRY